MNSYVPSKHLVKSLSNASKYWMSFQQQIHDNKREPRITAILVHLMIEYYINEIMITRQQMKKQNDKIEFIKKHKMLKKQTKNTTKFVKDVEKLYDIRNMYAHQIEINEKFIEGKLKTIKFPSQFSQKHFSQTITLPKDTQKKYLKLSEFLLTRLNGIYNGVLARHEQKHALQQAKSKNP